MYQASQNAIFQLWCWLACCFKVNCRHQGPNHLQASGIPHTTQTVEELFNLVDIDGSGIMEWSEYETFVANEIQEGRDFMEGEFVLPSGAGIQYCRNDTRLYDCGSQECCAMHDRRLLSFPYPHAVLARSIYRCCCMTSYKTMHY